MFSIFFVGPDDLSEMLVRMRLVTQLGSSWALRRNWSWRFFRTREPLRQIRVQDGEIPLNCVVCRSFLGSGRHRDASAERRYFHCYLKLADVQLLLETSSFLMFVSVSSALCSSLSSLLVSSLELSDTNVYEP